MVKALQVFMLALFVISQCIANINGENERSFTIDYEHDTFLMDGKPFRFVSGSFHYFRALPGSWRQILRSMRAGGLNAVMTYIEWSTHEPMEGVYKWDGIANLEQFIQIAEEEDLYVILRPGPYICAERDMGGFPYWLLTKYPNVRLRSYDTDYLREVEKWYGVLMPRIEKHLHGRGGPVIMVSIENEYGSFSACDGKYLSFLKNLTEIYVRNDAVMFTNDGPEQLFCGRIPNVLATLDFGSDEIKLKKIKRNNQPNILATMLVVIKRTISAQVKQMETSDRQQAGEFLQHLENVDNPDHYWQKLRKYQSKGPLVNAEYYPGWLTHWMEPMARVATGPVVGTLRKMLKQGASVNFYMFFGGTNFAFTAGANEGGPGRFNTDITSYDYDAPLDEAGDPTTKYFALRDVILEFLPDPGIPVPEKLPKMKFPPVKLNRFGTLLSQEARQALAKYSFRAQRTLGFEALNQHSGLIVYETDIPKGLNRDPLNLKVNNLHDRAYVHVDNKFIGVLSRENAIYSLPISLGGGKLQLVVENQGRINYGIANDFKGVLGAVTLDENELLNWTMTGFPLDDYSLLQNYIDQFSGIEDNTGRLSSVQIYHGGFIIADDDDIYDTYLDPTGWGKGVVFINGFNLGRYWPLVGPQVTLYVPRHILVQGNNTIIVIEYQKDIPENAVITFKDEPMLDGS